MTRQKPKSAGTRRNSSSRGEARTLGAITRIKPKASSARARGRSARDRGHRGEFNRALGKTVSLTTVPRIGECSRRLGSAFIRSLPGLKLAQEKIHRAPGGGSNGLQGGSHAALDLAQGL